MASIPARPSALILTQSKPLRLLTLLLFYFTQGFPIGIFFYAVPSWMTANGASTAQVGSVVAVAALPWSLKLVNGFLIDRYTFLPMGRRRSWIIGAQALIVAILLTGAVIAPTQSDVFMLSALGFIANMAVTFQDVGIDSLAVDIMAEDERAKAGGIMFGAQILGISAATALGGALLQNFGITAALVVLAGVPGVVALYGILIREREGERRLPWTKGESHPRNRDLQVEAWWPLLRSAFRAMIGPASLLLIPILLVRSLPAGAFETYQPTIFTQLAGWELSEYTGFISSVGFGVGIVGLIVGGWLVDAIGAQRSMLMAIIIGGLWMAGMGFSQPMWGESWFISSFVIGDQIFALFYSIAMIPICMRMCSPAVAATQFTIYMAISNFGRPLGAALAGATAGQGIPQWMYWSLAICWAVAAFITLKTHFPDQNRAFEQAAHDLPQGGGLAPVEN